MNEIVFGSENGTMGKLILDGEKLKFEGNVEESAQVLFNYVCKMFNNSSFGTMPCKNDQSTEHIELVKKWLAGPESVSYQELDKNLEAAVKAADSSNSAVAKAADWAAYWAVEGNVERAKHWVERYEELVK